MPLLHLSSGRTMFCCCNARVGQLMLHRPFIIRTSAKSRPTCGGLVKKRNLGLAQQLSGNAQPPLLPAREAAREGVAD